MPHWVQLYGKVQGSHKRTASGPLQGYSLPCNPCVAIYWLLSKVQRKPETPTILGCTWWLHLSSIMLTSYSRKVFLHPGCTPLHLELKQFELGLCSYDVESTLLQRSNRHVAMQRPLTTQGGDEIIAHTLTHFVVHGIKIAWTAFAGGKEDYLFTEYLLIIPKKKTMDWSGHFVKSHRGRQPCLRHTLLKMDGSEASASELLPYTEADGELAWGSEDEGLAWRKDELFSS